MYMYIFFPMTHILIFSFILSISLSISAGCIFVAIIIYGTKIPDNLSWSFALSIIGMLLEGVTALLLLVNRFRGGSVLVK